MLEQLFNTSPDAFYVLDKSGSVIQSNQGVTLIFDYTEDDLLGKPLVSFVHPEDVKVLQKEINASWEKASERFEVRLQTKNKEFRWLSLSISSSGESTLIVGRDVTRQKNEYQKLRTAQDRLRLLHQTTSDPKETLWQKIGRVLELGRKQLDMEHGVVAEIRGHTYNPIKISSEKKSLEEKKPLKLETVLDAITLTSGNTVGVHNLSKSIYAEHPGRKLTKANAYIGTPLFREEEFYGTLSFWSNRAREVPYDITEYDFIYSLGGWISSALALISANEHLAYDAAIVESSEDAIIAQTLEGEITLANKGAEKLLGYGIEEMLGENYQMLFPKEVTEDMGRIRQRLLQGEKVEHHNTLFKRKDGNNIDISLTISPIINDENDFVGFSSIARDITKDREIDKSKTEFVSLASHQMRTPLSSINWYAELLLNGKGGKLSLAQTDFVSEIFTSTKRMTQLVNDLLNVSRIELGTFTIDPEEVDLVKEAQSVIGELGHIIKHKKITVKENYKKVPHIQADIHLVRIIFQNLISNAIKYTKDKGEVYVSIDFLENNTKIGVEVHDTGIGIPKDQQNRVFSKLFRADNVKKMDAAGSGLGLYIVKSVVEESGGSVGFSSEEGVGSTFNVILPATGMKKREGTRKLE